jgi:DNA polymerase III delta prime subunit
MMDIKIKTYLDRLAQSEKRPNSYLFFGPEKLGKFKAAVHFIAQLAGKENDAEFLRRIAEKVHPDVVVVEPETVRDKKGRIREKEISVEQVRDARERLKFFPYELSKKFCLVKNAQRLNAESSNALLKILEEPSANTFFVLLASDIDSVLPTIASRCAILRFSETALPAWKEENREKLKQIFRQEIFEKFEYVEKIAKDKTEIIEVFGDWEKVAAESLRKLVFQNEEGRKIEKVAELIEKLRGAISQLEKTNASPRAVGEKLMLEI